MPLILYDITDKMCEDNAVGVVLGDGWAIGHVGSNYTFKRNSYNDHIEFTSVIKIEYDDGTVDEICTDNTWCASSGKILRSDIYMGEYVDNRLNIGDFSKADYDDSGWGFAEEKVFKFSPYFDLTGKINSVNGHYDTAYGRISVEWQRTGDYYEYRVSAPLEVECEFVFEA